MSLLSLRSSLSKENSNFTAKFNKKLTRPHQKNFRELLLGLILEGSTKLSRIGKVVAPEVTDRKNTERLANTLTKINSHELHQIHITAVAREYVEEKTLLLTDGGDIQKPYAKKMEKLCQAPDGSNNHKAGNGYPTLGCVAYGTESKKTMPLIHAVHSFNSVDYESDWHEQKKSLELLTPFFRSSHDRIIVEDRGCDDEKRFIYYTQGLEVSFLTRVRAAKSSRHICPIVDDEIQEKVSIQELARKLRPQAKSKKTYYNKKLKKELTSKIAYHEVRLPDHPELPLFLVLVYTEGFEEPMVFLTDQRVNDYENAWQIFFWYQKRWEVENFFRAIKQSFDAEGFLVRSFEKIQALAFLVMLAHALTQKLANDTKNFLGSLFYYFTDYCRKWQRTQETFLDILAFIRHIFTGDQSQLFSVSSYHHFSRRLCRPSHPPPHQPRLLDLRKVRSW